MSKEIKGSSSMKVEDQLVWCIDLSALIGRRIEVETDDGHYRSGILTEIIWRTMKVLGMEWDTPIALKLDLDEADHIPWSIIKTVKLV